MKANRHANEEDVPIFFHDRIHPLLLHGGTLPGGHGYGYDVPLCLRVNHKENKFPSLGDDLTGFLSKDK